MSDSKVNIRKIIGFEEEINRLDKQLNRPRINGGNGVSWMNGYGENGKEPTEEEKEEADKKDPGKGGTNNPDDKKDASEPLNVGDDVQDFGGLKDCSTGRCVNVRLNGNAPPPDGWNSVCDPPKDPTFDIKYYYKVSFYKHDYKTGLKETLDKSFRTQNEVKSAISSFFRADAVSYLGSFVWDSEPWLQKQVFPFGVDNLQAANVVKYPEDTENSAFYAVGSQKKDCSVVYDSLCSITTPPTEQWPEATCSEVVAGSGGFKGACPTHDPNLPSQFGSAQNEITLCDKDGNEVKFTKTDEGYEVYQAKYRRTAVVDPNTYKVVRFK